MQLSKTEFIQYLNCPKSLWLLKHDPDRYPKGEFSAFLQKLTREGYEVEKYVREYFLESGAPGINFQVEFKANDGLVARVDVLQITSEGKTFLYEIKSSTSIKTDDTHNQIKDACFQKICAERSGTKIDKVFIIHLNGNYVRQGRVDPSKLLIFEDVTQAVNDVLTVTNEEINQALSFLATDIELKGCSCVEKSRSHHCDTFLIFNTTVPELSIYLLPRLSSKNRRDLISRDWLSLEAIPDEYPFSDTQHITLLAAKRRQPQINLAAIRKFFEGLLYPLYFFDFETYGSAVPVIDGIRPHQQFAVQYSLHILEENGTLQHKEYLEREARTPYRLVQRMQEDIGAGGSIISWHASFEKARNREMALAFPDKAEFLSGVNSRMVDLEDVFKKDYVDIRFGGSSSIKKVLPIICPYLNYSDLAVQDGTSAMEAWERMIKSDKEEADKIAESLLGYCERDTLAMVEISRFLKSVS